MEKFNQINFIRCPFCGEFSLRVGDFGPNEYRITCDNCEFTSDTHLSDCGEVLHEFMCDEYVRRTLEGARNNRDTALHNHIVAECKHALGDKIDKQSILAYVKKIVDEPVWSTTTSRVSINKYILKLMIMMIEDNFDPDTLLTLKNN